jgi:hypothetical protein
MGVPNHLDLTQYINLVLSSILLAIMVVNYFKVPSVKGFALGVALIALSSIVFYVVVIITTLDESSPVVAAIVSGIRSAFTYTMMIGIGIMWLKLGRENKL